MTTSLPASPATAAPLVEHLSTWGEVSACELRQLGAAEPWLVVLRKANLVDEIEAADGKPAAWALSKSGEALLDVAPETATKMALFQAADYRAYLVGILAEGAALAAKTEMRGQLEDWTGGDLLPLLDEINAALDLVEASSGRLIDGSRQDIERRCAGLPGRDVDFSGWDQVLLGRSGRPNDLFDFALRKFAPLAMLPSPRPGEGRAVVVRALPLATTPDADPGQALLPGGWNVRRQRIHSGISLFDEHGRYLYDHDLPVREVLRPAVQDALVEHPVYKAVVNLAICSWRSPATTMPSIGINLPPGTELANTSLVVADRDAGRLRHLLPQLVDLQGVRLYGTNPNGVPADLMENVLRVLLYHDVLRQVEDEIHLHPDYQGTLMTADRLHSVFRPGKELQRRMLEVVGSGREAGAGTNEVRRP